MTLCRLCMALGLGRGMSTHKLRPDRREACRTLHRSLPRLLARASAIRRERWSRAISHPRGRSSSAERLEVVRDGFLGSWRRPIRSRRGSTESGPTGLPLRSRITGCRDCRRSRIDGSRRDRGRRRDAGRPRPRRGDRADDRRESRPARPEVRDPPGRRRHPDRRAPRQPADLLRRPVHPLRATTTAPGPSARRSTTSTSLIRSTCRTRGKSRVEVARAAKSTSRPSSRTPPAARSATSTGPSSTSRPPGSTSSPPRRPSRTRSGPSHQARRRAGAEAATLDSWKTSSKRPATPSTMPATRSTTPGNRSACS